DPLAELQQRFESPTNDTYVGSPQLAPSPAHTLFGAGGVHTIDEHPGRRWYPVIDFSRCTNCMECIDFCLFGVYGVDTLETIVVEQADNCRKGCPACSRVCPQNAIIFPQHKTPAIAGAPVDASGLKIDLSKLFGAPESDEDAAAVAARERDEQLILAGRQAVGTSGLTARLAEKASATSASDDLDELIDQLDSLDL
ncbi:MAG: ferredoxin family protein, partial [Pirellulaceae bacterium]